MLFLAILLLLNVSDMITIKIPAFPKKRQHTTKPSLNMECFGNGAFFAV